MPELSVIIPVYNGAAEIGPCLDSILAQSDAAKYEIIVVNDGSTDNTMAVLSEYANKYHNIRIINQKNMGVSMARNNAIDAARGKYITFVDCDDLVGIAPGCVAQYFENPCARHSNVDAMEISQIKFAETPRISIKFDKRYFVKMLDAARVSDSDIAFAGKITLNYDANYIKRHTYSYNKTYGTSAADKSGLIQMADVRESANFALYRKSFLDMHKLRFVRGMPLDEDILFCMLAALHAKRATTVAYTAYLYNRHMNTTSNFSDNLYSNMRYSVANIQRYSTFLAELGRYPEYGEIYSDWIKKFAINGTVTLDMPERYPSSRCAQCNEKTCTGCYIRPVMDERFVQNIAHFARASR